MKKIIGIVGLVILVILAVILLLFDNKKPSNINNNTNTNNTAEDTNEILSEPESDNKIHLYVERENNYHKYTSLVIEPSNNEGFLYIERKTDDSLKNLEIKLTIFDGNNEIIFKNYLDIDNESIDSNGYIKFSFTEDLSLAKTYSVDVESKPYYG